MPRSRRPRSLSPSAPSPSAPSPSAAALAAASPGAASSPAPSSGAASSPAASSGAARARRAKRLPLHRRERIVEPDRLEVLPDPISPFGRPDAATRAAALRLVAAIGLPSLCPEAACRRARRCADPDTSQLPTCIYRYRGLVRFAIEYAARRRGWAPPPGALPPEAPEGPHDDPDRDVIPERSTLLGALRAAGYPVDALARRPEDGTDEPSWAIEPTSLAAALAAAHAEPET